jgi:hypothetical protein
VSDKMTREDAQKMFDDAVRILREDAQLAHNRALMARLDAIESQTRREPKTPEEKAAEYDRLMAERNKPSGTGNPPATPPQLPGTPSPPQAKPPTNPSTEHDWWWGGSE